MSLSISSRNYSTEGKSKFDLQAEIEAFTEEYQRCEYLLDHLTPSDFEVKAQYELQVEGLERSMDELQRMWNAARARFAELEGDDFNYSTIDDFESPRNVINSILPKLETRCGSVLLNKSQDQDRHIDSQIPLRRASTTQTVKRVERMRIMVAPGIFRDLDQLRADSSNVREVSWDEFLEKMIGTYQKALNLEEENRRLNATITEIAVKNAATMKVIPITTGSVTPPIAPPISFSPSQDLSGKNPPPPFKPPPFKPPPGETPPPKKPAFKPLPRNYDDPNPFKNVLQEMKDLFKSGTTILKSTREVILEEEQENSKNSVKERLIALLQTHQPIPNKITLEKFGADVGIPDEELGVIFDELREKGILEYSRKNPRGYFIKISNSG